VRASFEPPHAPFDSAAAAASATPFFDAADAAATPPPPAATMPYFAMRYAPLLIRRRAADAALWPPFADATPPLAPLMLMPPADIRFTTPALLLLPLPLHAAILLPRCRCFFAYVATPRAYDAAMSSPFFAASTRLSRDVTMPSAIFATRRSAKQMPRQRQE